MTERSLETTPQVTNPDLANVMGYAERPFMEVASIAQQQGIAEVADELHSQATKAGIEAGRTWIIQGAQELLAQVEPVSAADSRIDNSFVQKDAMINFTLPQLEKGGAEVLEPPEIPTVSQKTLARVAAFIAGRDGTYRADIKDKLKLSPATINKVITPLILDGYVKRTLDLQGSPGRPFEVYSRTDKMDRYIAHVPEWRRTAELLLVAEHFGYTEEEATEYLVELGKSSLLASGNVEG